MSRRGPRAVEVVLSAEERAELLLWADGAVPARAAERARIVLACADGESNTAVATGFGVSAETVRKWRSRFVARRMAGLADEPRPGRRKPELVLSDAERAELTRWTRRAKTAQFLALRARIVLRCAQGGTNKEIAAELGIAHNTVSRWRSRFVRLRLDGLSDEPRPGRPSSILLDQVEDVLTATLESTPGQDTHWSRASMAQHCGLSKSTIGRIWKKFDLKPHLQDAFKLSTDPQFIAKVVDVVGLYHHPPEKAVVLCVDEKSQIQALDRSQPVLPMMPGMPERRTHDYYRHGITSLFAAFNITDGTVISELHRRHRALEFKKFLVRIDKAVPTGLDVHLVCDNYATHNTAEIRTWFGKHPRFHVHFTPTGSSWMNQVERWFGLLTDKLIRRGVHTSVKALEDDIRAWIEQWNEDPKPFTWTKTADEILHSLADYLTKISPPTANT
ncbi:IS630 family transposase [Streptomyces sp. NPDC058286]|uniref:IS630 family transposase n=1 Tax=Streptomyces sp. NPDC058286 TaxID=3346422 RepID=UPI0036F14C4F